MRTAIRTGALFISLLAGSYAHAQVFWGANAHPAQGGTYSSVTLDEQMALLNEMGLSSYRMDLADEQIANHNPDFRCAQKWDATTSNTIGPNIDLLKTAVASAKAHGISVLPILHATPPSYPSESCAYQSGYGLGVTYAGNAAFSGIFDWELGNEFDNYAILGPQYDGSNISQYDPTRYAIARGLLRGMLDGIHSVNPSFAGIVDAAEVCHYGFQRQLIADGVHFDLTGYHWYSDAGNITSANCPTPNVLSVLKSFGKPIFLTEFNSKNYVDPPNQGTYLVSTMKQWTSVAASNYIAGAYVYQLLDQNPLTYCNSTTPGDGYCEGLADNSGNILQSGLDVQSYINSPHSSSFLNWSAGQLTLYPGEEVNLTNSTFLAFQPDGNLVVYNSSRVALWASNTPGNDCRPSQNCRVMFQTDGNFVIYRGSTALWATMTNSAGFVLTFSDSAPYLSIQNAAGAQLWSTGGTFTPTVLNFMGNALNLLPNERVTLSNGTYLGFQGDGNLVILSSAGSVLWSSKTAGHNCNSNCNALFQSDGNFVIYQGTTALWASFTADAGSLLTFSSVSPYLKILNTSNAVIWQASSSN